MASRRPTSRYATPVRKKPSFDFSFTGLIYCALMMFLGLAAVQSQANLLFAVFGLMIGVLLASVSISRVILRRLHVRRVIPDHVVVAEPATITYEFANDKRFWPSVAVSLGEIDGCEAFTRQPYTYMLHAAGHMMAIVPTEVLPKRRGVHALDSYQISTSFPFGFIKRAIMAKQADSIVVYPAIGQVDPKLLMLCRSVEKSGAQMRPRQGGDDEFYGVKEYRAGENPRWIYWRHSARTGTLVSKQMTQVAPPRVVLLVDTLLAQRTPEAHAAVERTIAMAGSLASHALEAGLDVGVAAWAGDWVTIAPNRGKRQRRDILALLARLPLNSAHNAQALYERCGEILHSGTTAVLLTPHGAQLGFGDQVRGGIVVIAAGSPEAQRWFHFDPGVDFARCMPPDQQPEEVTSAR